VIVYPQIEGVMYCVVHDDVAVEGYDWSDICREQRSQIEEFGNEDERGDGDPELVPCVLVPVFYRGGRRFDAAAIATGVPSAIFAGWEPAEAAAEVTS
jgi:hypothetical protein